ncbi:MYB-like transcription factor ETC1 isoform X2 [Quercus robur]|uniref:MYB-like transcription factor ETC1 isoform X2 n=1 Tax=Quercus robur TaxID=38942 RepID=UPI0021631A1E|nr:MYB-like transcription factor ETC1 isoform X2 [Quercus robur]
MASLDHSTSTDTDDSTTTTLDSKDNNKETELQFSYDEETLVIRMFNLVGERWSLIAGRIPGRTAEEIEKYWNSRYSTSE